MIWCRSVQKSTFCDVWFSLLRYVSSLFIYFLHNSTSRGKCFVKNKRIITFIVHSHSTKIEYQSKRIKTSRRYSHSSSYPLHKQIWICYQTPAFNLWQETLHKYPSNWTWSFRGQQQRKHIISNAGKAFLFKENSGRGCSTKSTDKYPDWLKEPTIINSIFPYFQRLSIQKLCSRFTLISCISNWIWWASRSAKFWMRSTFHR